MFLEDVDVIISTSSIQNGQSIKENILSIFVYLFLNDDNNIRWETTIDINNYDSQILEVSTAAAEAALSLG